MTRKTIKELEPIPCKSIIRLIWVKMKEWGDETLQDKKDTCYAVIEEAIQRHHIKSYVGEYMINKIKGMKTEKALQWYLINSKNYFEKNFYYTNA